MTYDRNIKEFLDKKYLDWRNFVLHNDIPKDVDPIILESWKDCKRMGINHESVSMELVDRKLWEKKLENNIELINVARPIIERFYPTMSDNQDLICLYDKNGCMLDFWVPENYIPRHETYSSKKGLKFPEHIHGTNSVELCLKHDKPIQVTGAEHYNRKYMEATCYTAPIHDEDGMIMGCIHLTGKAEDTNPHLLISITMAAMAIETQVALTRASDLVNRSMDVMSEAALILDKDFKIVRLNKRIIELFQIRNENLLYGLTFKDWLKDETVKNKVLKRHETGDIFELKVKLQDTVRNCNLRITPIVRYNRFIGTIILLTPIKELALLANKMSGNHSYYTFQDIITQNDQLKYTIEMAKKISDTDCTVLIESESGTGKELFAHSIHNRSKRRNKPMVVVNCATLPRNLVESELFGYEKRAFSGAKESGQPGKFELAHGGTLFLDEIGELPLEIQPKLLRVLEDSKVTRLGGNNEIDLDVRIITATNRKLEDEIQQSNFREDLYYRINVIKLDIVPLRKRPDDIEMLAQLFLNRLLEREPSIPKVMTPEFVECLKSYTWPGNVRELQNLISKAYYMSLNEIIDKALFEYIYPLGSYKESLQKKRAIAAEETSKFSLIELNERNVIQETLLNYPGDIKSAYNSLGMSRSTFYRRLEKYELNQK